MNCRLSGHLPFIIGRVISRIESEFMIYDAKAATAPQIFPVVKCNLTLLTTISFPKRSASSVGWISDTILRNAKEPTYCSKRVVHGVPGVVIWGVIWPCCVALQQNVAGRLGVTFPKKPACGVWGYTREISHKSKGRCRVLDHVDVDWIFFPSFGTAPLNSVHR